MHFQNFHSIKQTQVYCSAHPLLLYGKFFFLSIIVRWATRLTSVVLLLPLDQDRLRQWFLSRIRKPSKSLYSYNTTKSVKMFSRRFVLGRNPRINIWLTYIPTNLIKEMSFQRRISITSTQKAGQITVWSQFRQGS